MVQQRGCLDQNFLKKKNETFLRETLLEIFTESLLIRDKLVKVTFLLSNLELGFGGLQTVVTAVILRT